MFFLFLKQFHLAGVVAARHFGEHIFAQGREMFGSDHFAADSGLEAGSDPCAFQREFELDVVGALAGDLAGGDAAAPENLGFRYPVFIGIGDNGYCLVKQGARSVRHCDWRDQFLVGGPVDHHRSARVAQQMLEKEIRLFTRVPVAFELIAPAPKPTVKPCIEASSEPVNVVADTELAKVAA